MSEMDTLNTAYKAPKSGQEAKQAVIMVHGYGADGRDLIGLADVFAEHLPDTAFYAPDGPHQCETNPYGRQWFSIADSYFNQLQGEPEQLRSVYDEIPNGLKQTAPLLSDFINRVMIKHNLEPRKLALLGFSQGTVLSLHVGLRQSEMLGGIVGFSGALVGVEKLPKEIKTKPPVILIHGSADPLVPVISMTLAETALSENKVPCETHIIEDCQHGIAPEGSDLAAQFLQAKLAS